jgi:hypothetical protein
LNYSLIDGKVTREDGYVAVQHIITNPTNTSISGTVYVFSPKFNVSLAWVAPEHLDKVLSVKADRGCNCGGVKKNKFLLSSMINVNLWNGLTRDGESR